MNQWVSLVLFLIFTAGLVLLIIQNVKYLMENKRLISDNAQLLLNNHELLKKFQAIVDQKNVEEIEDTKGFVRFISESRDWAFEYIENVQTAIKELSETPRSDRAGYAKAYKKVIDFLPEETINN
jgi:hypothetical protein